MRERNMAPSSAGNTLGPSLLGAALLLACANASAATPSFLCSTARTWVEKTICGSERLSELDLDLAQAYARLLRVVSGEAEKTLTANQRRWWAAREECRRQADPVGCLETRYTERIAQLKSRPDYTEVRAKTVELPPERIAAVGEGWTKSLSRYFKAMRACMRKAPAPVRAIGAAWDDPDQDQAVGVRMRGPDNQNWVCVARRNGSEVVSLRETNEYEPLPAEGPLFYPDPSPPANACGKPVQVLDELDAPVGWVGPRCPPAPAAASESPARTGR
jgi:uncharacterized protein